MTRPPERRNRPAGNGPAPEISTAIKIDASVRPTRDASAEAAERRRWARGLIDRASGSVPRYGSAAWLALPDGAPEKVAGVVVSAECWAVEGDDLAVRVDQELRAEREAQRRLDVELFEAEVVPMVRAMARRPARYAGQPVRPLEVIGAEHAKRMGLRQVDPSEIA